MQPRVERAECSVGQGAGWRPLLAASNNTPFCQAVGMQYPFLHHRGGPASQMEHAMYPTACPTAALPPTGGGGVGAGQRVPHAAQSSRSPPPVDAVQLRWLGGGPVTAAVCSLRLRLINQTASPFRQAKCRGHLLGSIREIDLPHFSSPSPGQPSAPSSWSSVSTQRAPLWGPQKPCCAVRCCTQWCLAFWGANGLRRL